MITEKNLILTRAEPNGQGGVQFIYRLNNYGVVAISRPREEIAHINWEVDVIRYTEEKAVRFEVCHTTKLANKTLTFSNDNAVDEFLEKAFEYFQELDKLEGIPSK